MHSYKNILVAVDLHPDCDQTTLDQAIEVAKEYKAKLTVVHAIEHINAYGVAQAYPSVMDLEDQLLKDARQELDAIVKKKQLSAADVRIEVGSPKMVILDLAKSLNIDLIIVGSHGRHGFSMLLGSTANAVLHHAGCDVLAVRIQ